MLKENILDQMGTIMFGIIKNQHFHCIGFYLDLRAFVPDIS